MPLHIFTYPPVVPIVTISHTIAINCQSISISIQLKKLAAFDNHLINSVKITRSNISINVASGYIYGADLYRTDNAAALASCGCKN